MLQLEIISGDGQTGPCFTELPDPVVVRAVREQGNAPLPGQVVSFRVTEGGGWVYAGTATSNSRGLAAEYWTLGHPGAQRLEARVVSGDGLKQVLGTFTATAEGGAIDQRITTHQSAQYHPAISGDRVVWADSLLGNAHIYMYDASSEAITAISMHPAQQGRPDIWDDKIVWQDSRNENWDIFLYDLATQTEIPITDDPAAQWGPRVSDDRVVWTDERHGNRDIYLYDVTIQTETRITYDPTDQFDPDISGDRIVYSSGGSIYLYDLTTHTETRITYYPAEAGGAAIDGDVIVWMDIRAGEGDSDIYMYDLTSHTETRLTFDPASIALYPKISGDRIVWETYTNSAPSMWALHVYNRSTEEVDQVTSGSIGGYPLPYRERADISDGVVAWEDLRLFGNPDIYLHDVRCIVPD
jgi:beta propeller repeat protein